MQNFIRKPSVDLMPGIRVTKNTEIDFENDNVKQKVENLILHTVMHTKGEGYAVTTHSTVYLDEGDVLLFEEDGRGYIKPVDGFVTIAEAIDDLTSIKDLG